MANVTTNRRSHGGQLKNSFKIPLTLFLFRWITTVFLVNLKERGRASKEEKKKLLNV